MARKKKEQELIRKREMATSGGRTRLNSKNGCNWRKKEKIFAGKQAHVSQGHIDHRKKQKHHRGPDYYENRRIADPEWAKGKPKEERKKSLYETVFPWKARK